MYCPNCGLVHYQCQCNPWGTTPAQLPLAFSPHEDSPQEVTRPLPNPFKPGCTECGVELCHELDAYYGDMPWLATMCSKCRRKRTYA